MVSFVVFFLFLCLVSGCFSYSVWWAMGSPFLNEFGQADYNSGRILSKYGAWLARRHKASEEAKKAGFQHFYGHLEAGSPEYLEAYREYYFERQDELDFLKPMGLCLVCFATHVNNLVGIGSASAMYYQGFVSGWGLAFYVVFFWSVSTVITRKIAQW